MSKERFNRVRCTTCNRIVGADKTIKEIERCLRCHKGKKRQRTQRTASSSFARTKKGPAKDLPSPQNKIYFRSGWERNFARWLTITKKKWTYEQRSYPFTQNQKTGKPYRRGPWVYIPDFEEEDGTVWEVKGMFLPKDRAKIKRMKACHPEELKKLKICCSKSNKNAISFYTTQGLLVIFIEDLNKEWKDKIPAWE